MGAGSDGVAFVGYSPVGATANLIDLTRQSASLSRGWCNGPRQKTFPGMDIKDFSGTTPILRPEEYLAHELEGWGVVERLTGGLQQRFTVTAQGRWDPNAGVLHFNETWTFDDGRKDTLAWRITPTDNGRYVGNEPRLEGEAEGQQAGCAFHWRYSRDTPLGDGKSMLLNFNDWFYRIDDRVVMIRGSAGRAGIPFSILHATYRRT